MVPVNTLFHDLVHFDNNVSITKLRGIKIYIVNSFQILQIILRTIKSRKSDQMVNIVYTMYIIE